MEDMRETDVIRRAVEGDDFFQCKNYRARLLKSACIRRQTEGVRHSVHDYIKTIPDGCRDCEQGKAIRIGLSGGVGLEKETEMTKARSIIGECKNCLRPGIKVETVARGFCGSCKSIAAKHKDPAEREAALAEAKIRLQRKGIQDHSRKRVGAKADVRPEASPARGKRKRKPREKQPGGALVPRPRVPVPRKSEGTIAPPQKSRETFSITATFECDAKKLFVFLMENGSLTLGDPNV